MAQIEIYTKQWCPYCLKAKALLHSKAIVYDEVDVTADEARQAEMVERCAACPKSSSTARGSAATTISPA
jgi:glutaredoxin